MTTQDYDNERSAGDERPLSARIPSNESDPDRTAADIKELVKMCTDLSTSELRKIPVLQPGDRLTPGGTYLDLVDRERGEFVAEADDVVRADTWIVPKDRIDYKIWNRLRRVDH